MEHTNKIAIKILTEEHNDYPRNAWHYDSEYRMIVKAIEISNHHGLNQCNHDNSDIRHVRCTTCIDCGELIEFDI